MPTSGGPLDLLVDTSVAVALIVTDHTYRGLGVEVEVLPLQ